MKRIITAALALTMLGSSFMLPSAESFTISPAAITAEAADKAPAKVTSVKASALTDTTAKLSWKKVSGAKGYRIYVYDKTAKKYKKLATLSGGKTSYTLKGLKEGTSYKYKVRAYKKANGKTNWGKSSAAVSVKAKSYTPAKVTGVAATDIEQNSATLIWSKASNAKGYRIYRYNEESGKYEKFTTVSGADNTSYRLTWLTEGKTFRYKVRAYSKANGKTYWGKSSDECKFTTKEESLSSKLCGEGSFRFYDLYEYAKKYNWMISETKVLKKTDSEYAICGKFTDYLVMEPFYMMTTATFDKNGEIVVSYFRCPTSDGSDYDSINTPTTYKGLKECIIANGHL